MSYQIIVPDECDDCMEYVKVISDGSPWKCVCCSMTEATLYLGKREGVFLWHRYQLRCGHQCHERCYRRWCRQEGKIGCPTCGLIEQDKENQFCSTCNSWGHPRTSCPMLRLRFYTAAAAALSSQSFLSSQSSLSSQSFLSSQSSLSSQ